MEVLLLEYNIHYRDCVGSFICILYKRVDLCFEVHKLERFSSNPGILNFDGLVHLLRYIRYNKNLGWYIIPRYIIHLYLTSWDRLAIITRTNLWCSIIPYGRTVQILVEIQEHIYIFNQGGSIDHFTHVTGTVAQ